MKYSSFLFTGIFWTCLMIHTIQAQTQNVHAILRQLKDPASSRVLVVAHRGDWRHAPENSLAAITLAIAMGVDIIEVDVQKTKDNYLVLMHDQTIDRTTNGTGKVADYTLDELRKFRLRNGLARLTPHSIPTLEEALRVVKGKALLNLDKCYEYLPEAYDMLQRLQMVDHAIFKGYYLTASQVQTRYGEWLDKIMYMAMVRLEDPDACNTIDEFFRQVKPVAFELSFQTDTLAFLQKLNTLKKRGAQVWINSLWASQNGGHDDDRAETDLEGSYQWLIDKGATIIQTDRPEALLSYLRKRKLHP